MQNSRENEQGALKDLRNQVAQGCVSLLSCQNGTRKKHSCENEFADKTHDVGKCEHKSIKLLHFVLNVKCVASLDRVYLHIW